MSIFCKLGRHRALPDPVWNAGHFFGRCAACGCDLIRTHETEWHAVPRGKAIVWKPRQPGDVNWTEFRDAPLSPAARAALRARSDAAPPRAPIEIRLN